MQRQTIDRETLLDRAYGIAEEEGLSALSIRKLATECDVAVGSVYNYFPAKADLTTAIIERFFSNAFFEGFCHPAVDEAFVPFCRRLSVAMQTALSGFRADWLAEIGRLSVQERARGKAEEAVRLRHVERGLMSVFENDHTIDHAVLPSELAAEPLCHFVLRSLMILLRDREDPEVLFALLDAALYGEKA